MKPHIKKAAATAAIWAAGLSAGYILGPLIINLDGGVGTDVIAMKIVVGVVAFPLIFGTVWLYRICRSKAEREDPGVENSSSDSLPEDRLPVRQWYYHDSVQENGPIGEGDFVRLFESGSLPADTLVWTEGLEKWQEARTIENLVPSTFAPSPAEPHRGEAVSASEKAIPNAESTAKKPNIWNHIWVGVGAFLLLFLFLPEAIRGTLATRYYLGAAFWVGVIIYCWINISGAKEKGKS